ncbi:MAG TPA: three-Cys-motif partner protein TcmP [Candidatus Acidoferrum sp.]|nr:three-Cys-motif partner protein TcmP [Candidatus Acidoferrum sp.]
MAIEYDEIGIWSEVKLAIIKEYASAYGRIMEATRRDRIPSLRWLYIDAYAGPGYHLSQTSGELVEGSPLIALNTEPPFHEYHFIDSERARSEQLRRLAGPRLDVFTYSEDCNKALLGSVFPRVEYGKYKRALCLLDPYNIDLTWEVIEAAGKSNSIEIFMNFMIMDINRNALRKDPDKSIPSKVAQMTRLWGDETWKEAGYDQIPNLFEQLVPQKVTNERFAEAFRQRLEGKAGFKFVPKPMPMKITNSNTVIYYLYFASQKEAGMDIVNDIFNKYRAKQGL